MSSQELTVLRPRRRRLVYAAMEAYVGWCDEGKAVRDAYRRWTSAGETDAALAFHTYAAALDREEHASEVYARLIQRVGLFLSPEDRPGARVTVLAPFAGASPEVMRWGRSSDTEVRA